MQGKLICSLCLAALLALPAVAQDPATSTTPDDQQTTTNQAVTPMQNTPVFRVNVVERELEAVNYQHKNGSTKVDLVGTRLMPQAKGEASVNGHTGRLSIGTKFEHMVPATTFGPQYLTYVLWAVTPNGRPVNLGEVVPDHDGDFHMQVTSDLQAFGLMVTAEPYFAVTRPSDMVVLENQVRRDTKGWEQPITAKYESLSRNEYTADLNPNALPATGQDRHKVPIDLLEAENAIAIASAEGGDKYAPEAMARARDFLTRGKDYVDRHQPSSAIGTVTRGAIENAEDARLISVRKHREEVIAAERAQQQQRVEEARRRAEDEAARAQEARDQAQQAQDQAQQAEQARLQAQQERESALQAQQQAEAAAQQAAQERAAAEQARQAAIAQQQQLAQQAEQARVQAQQFQQQAALAERQKEETRARLMSQLNQVLQTRDTARGLIVNMSDVLFDFNKATLKPGAKLRLAKVAGIIQAYPDLKLQIEGFTDNVGTEQYNQQLSERRADTVRQFLVAQGVPEQNVIARGLGEADPVATNSTSAGRQMNRRVDLVVSGESIQSAKSMQNGNAGAPGATGGAVGAASNAPGATPSSAEPGSVASPSTSNPASTPRTVTPEQQTPPPTPPPIPRK